MILANYPLPTEDEIENTRINEEENIRINEENNPNCADILPLVNANSIRAAGFRARALYIDRNF